MAYGAAPYKHEEGKQPSYFVTLRRTPASVPYGLWDLSRLCTGAYRIRKKSYNKAFERCLYGLNLTGRKLSVRFFRFLYRPLVCFLPIVPIVKGSFGSAAAVHQRQIWVDCGFSSPAAVGQEQSFEKAYSFQ